jgi:hypothetical protein
MDGNYAGTLALRLERADTIILRFLTYVVGFRRRRRAALLEQLARHAAGRTVVVLRSRRAILPTAPAPTRTSDAEPSQLNSYAAAHLRCIPTPT